MNTAEVIPFQSTEYPIKEVRATAYTIPTDSPESDGTYQWDSTTMVIAEVQAGNAWGIGFTYGAKIAAKLIEEKLRPEILGKEALNIPNTWSSMIRSVRNIGRQGISSMAISAVDFALWDLKAKILGVAVHKLLGVERNEVPVYGSGGFTSYSINDLQKQLGGWVEMGIPSVKMKVGRHPDQDPLRVLKARQAIGVNAELFVDANGAYDRKQALVLARLFSDANVSWFEEPVSSDDLEGLRWIRNQVPPKMDVAAGEYGFDLEYFLRMISKKAVDVIQVDATRCCGITGALKVIGMADAAHFPLSGHCAPSMHVALACHSKKIRHLEYFHDHVRIEQMLFDGVIRPVNGVLKPDSSSPGFGLVLKKKEAGRFAA